MDPLFFLTELFSPVWLIALSLFVVVIFSVSNRHNHHLPPGPKPWPVIGNIPHVDKRLHVSLNNLAKLHGPLMTLRLGTQFLFVASSPAAATEILRTHDRELCGRSIPNMTPLKMPDLLRCSIIWAPARDENWKSLRSMCRNELFSAKAMESQSSLREKKVSEMLDFLRSKEGKEVKVAEAVFVTVFNMLGGLCFSKDFIQLGNEGDSSELKETLWRMMFLGTVPNVADFYPILAGLDPQGLRKEAKKCVDKIFSIWEVSIRERRRSGSGGHRSKSGDSTSPDLLDVMLSKGFSDLAINNLALEIFSAGSDTTTTSTEWAMAELIKNKEVMRKLREELEKAFSGSSMIRESEISNLPYLNACVKETLRLHAPIPVIGRRALEACEVMNYTIPKDSKLLINVWALGRDPNLWDEPLSFKPERFLSSDKDFRGQDFEFLPFGGGRRLCPGIPLATKQFPMILAALVHFFDWSLPNDMDSSELSLNDKLSISLQMEKPLVLVPKQKHHSLIKDF